MSARAPARLAAFIIHLAVLAVLAACGGSDAPTGPVTPPPTGGHGGGGDGARLTMVRVTPSTANVLAGNTTRLVAAAVDASGRTVSGASLSWESLATSVAIVSGDGTVTGIVAGRALIVARSGGFADTATITVEGIAGGSVTVEPSKLALRLGTTGVLTASVRDVSGTVIGQPVTWSTDAPSTVSVSSIGIVNGMAVGTARIIATRGTRADTSVVTVAPTSITGIVSTVIISPDPVVVPRGKTVQLSTVAQDDQGALVSGYPLSWRSLDPSVASVSAGGTVTGNAQGMTRVIAVVGAAADTVSVSVGPPPIGSVLISPRTMTLSVGSSTMLVGIARDALDNALAGRTLSWRSDSPDVVNVTASGRVTAASAGVARIIVAAEGHADTAYVTVRAGAAPPKATSVVVTPSPVSLTVGGTELLSATVSDGSGGTLGSASVIWKSSNPAVAAVSVSGTITAIAAGSATITATSDGASGTALVTVTALAPSAATVTVSPTPVTLSASGTQTLSAVVRDGSGGTMSGAAVTWKSSDASVATVSASGVVTAVAAGSATITASSGSASGSAAVTVGATQPGATSVTVTPGSLSLAVGGTRTLNATVRDGAGSVVGGATVEWKSSNAAVATVSASGVVTAVAIGSATITATSGGVSGTTSVSVAVAEPVPASVALNPSSVTLRVGVTEALRVTVRDAGGTVIGGTTMVWETSNAAVATVSSTGIVSAVGAGSATITVTTGTVSATALITVTVPVRETVVKQATDIGTIGEMDGMAAQLPGVLVAGDDDESDFAPLQAFITYSLADLPTDARIESASLGLVMESAGVFGNPFGLGGLYVEWTSALAINHAAPTIASVLVTGAYAGTTATDVTSLVEAARQAGASSITFRLRFALPRNNNDTTDQLELAADALKITYAR